MEETKTIYNNLMRINQNNNNSFNEETIYKVANSRLGWYKMAGMNIVNYILSAKVLETAKRD